MPRPSKSVKKVIYTLDEPVLEWMMNIKKNSYSIIENCWKSYCWVYKVKNKNKWKNT